MAIRHSGVGSEALAATLTLPVGVSIRAWDETDFPAIQTLAQAEGWSTPRERPGEALTAWQRSWPALVAVVDGALIGFCRALSDGDVTTYVAELLVAPGWRRRGIATALLDMVKDGCVQVRDLTCWPRAKVEDSTSTWGFGRLPVSGGAGKSVKHDGRESFPAVLSLPV